MNEFLQTSLTFPTLPYSVLLVFCVIYWSLAATGLVDADGPDSLLGGDGDDAGWHSIAGIVARLGLAGVPLTIILTVLTFFGWTITYLVQLWFLQPLPAPLRLGLGAVVALLALVPGVVATSLLLRPVARLLLKLRPPVAPSLLGRTAVVSTPTVSADYGMATMDDGGAGLILQIRHSDPDVFRRGDRVVLIELLDGQHAYRVVSEAQFNRL